MVTICAGWKEADTVHACGQLLAIRCGVGHEHRFPVEGVVPEIARMLVEVGLRCPVPSCKLPINIEEVSHGECKACEEKALEQVGESPI